MLVVLRIKNLPLGKNIDEVLRIVDAGIIYRSLTKFVEQTGEATHESAFNDPSTNLNLNNHKN